jgi:four helix bundle protein
VPKGTTSLAREGKHHFTKQMFFAILGLKESVNMSESKLRNLSMDFAVEIVNLCDAMKGKNALTNQLLRSGTSIGANIHEANYASSRADFIAKMQIALKECYETEYWLKLFVKTNIIGQDIYSKLSNDSGKIRRILISSINTAKRIF